MTNRKYDEKFIHRAVVMSYSPNASIDWIAAHLGITVKLLLKWRNEAESESLVDVNTKHIVPFKSRLVRLLTWALLSVAGVLSYIYLGGKFFSMGLFGILMLFIYPLIAMFTVFFVAPKIIELILPSGSENCSVCRMTGTKVVFTVLEIPSKKMIRKESRTIMGAGVGGYEVDVPYQEYIIETYYECSNCGRFSIKVDTEERRII